MRIRRSFVGVFVSGMLALGLAACGDSGSSSSGSSDTIIRGTTDQPVSLDPAGAYDLPSYDVIYNVYQNLLTVPPGGNKPQPEAADCRFSGTTTYECTLKSGLSSPTARRWTPTTSSSPSSAT